MKIVRPGRVPVCCYRGTCYSCGCMVECTAAEVRKNKIINCPTLGCVGQIHLQPTTSKPYDDEPHQNPWMPTPIPKSYPRWSLQSPPFEPQLVVERFDTICLLTN